MALAELAGGNTDAAVRRRSLAQAITLAPDYDDAILLRADINISRGDLASAIGSLTEVIKQRPQQIRAHLLLADAYLRQKNSDQALAVYRQMLKLFPQDPRPPFLIGTLFARQNLSKDARTAFEEALRIAPAYLRGAVWWAITVVFCLGLTALLKVLFYGCPPMPDLHSPSGHTSLGTLVYGAVTLFAGSQTGGVRRITAISTGTGFILAIAVSRLLLHVHSLIEIGVGLAIGTAVLALFGLRYPRYRAEEMWLFPLFATGGALVVVLHGQELRAEEFVREIAGLLQIHCG